MNDNEASIPRVRYHEGQRLRREDLDDEQTHRLEALYRHQLRQHGAGVVRGLGLAVEAGELVLRPGMAVDPGGRTLVVPQTVRVPLATLGLQDTEEAALTLVYRESLDDDPGRFHEEAVLRLSPEPPADGVPLGRLRRTGSEAEVLPGERRPAGLAGEAVTAPRGGAYLELGRENRPGAAHRFAVCLRDATGALLPRLTVHADGRAYVAGHLTAGGGLRLRRHEDAATLRLEAATGGGGGRRPRLYRASGDEGSELRLETTDPGERGNRARHRVAIGCRDADGTFRSFLTVAADGTVEVRGDLEIRGELTQAPLKADLEDPQFLAGLLQVRKAGRERGLLFSLLKGKP